MISYYKSKHPGLFLYLILVSVSVLLFLFLEIKASHIGILSILWGSFIFMRTLSLYEVSEHFSPFTKTDSASKNNNHKESDLPHDLLHRMSGKNNLKRGMFAMSSMHGRTLLWFVLGITYAAYNLYLSRNAMPQHLLIQNISVFFIIGAAFWAGQTYAYSNQASKLILLIFSLLFGLALFKINTTFTTTMYDTLIHQALSSLEQLSSLQTSALPVLATLLIYSILILFNSFLKGASYSINALLGLSLIIILSIIGITFEPTPQTIALWISGWGLFSIFWIRSYCQTDKSYTLYQCE